jgi:predicted ATPase
VYELIAELARLAVEPRAADEVRRLGFELLTRELGAVEPAIVPASLPAPAREGFERVALDLPLDAATPLHLAFFLPNQRAHEFDPAYLGLVATQFAAAIRAADLAAQAPPVAPFAIRHNLPAYTNRFVGRAAEVAQMNDALAGNRLVTIVGPGGVGKTRLAIAVAAQVAARYAGGVWFVDLSGLFDGTRIYDHIAAALGVREDPNAPIERTLLDYLNDLSALLVLDNCEHLLADASEIVQRILRDAAHVGILATSREPLDLAGECAIRVATLPPADSIALFRERGGAGLDAGAREEIMAQICAQLDGIPMAIELAAARLSTLSLEGVQQGLADRFALLRNDGKRTPDRQQTLAALFVWSCNLLDERERLTLAELSVFAGTFTEDAGAKVVLTPLPMAMIEELVSKSLVLREESGRMRLPNSLLEFIKRELTAEQRAATEHRHAAYYRDLAIAANERYLKISARDWIASLDLERDNLRIALQRCIGAPSITQIGAQLAGALRRYWEFGGQLSEGATWYERYLAALPETAPAAIRARLYVERARLLESLAQFAPALVAACAAVALYRSIDDPDGLSYALNLVGTAAMFDGDTIAAEAYFTESLGILDTLVVNPVARATALGYLGTVALHDRLDFDRAERHLNDALKVYEELNHEANQAWAHGMLAEVCFRRGTYAAALEREDRAIAMIEAIGNHPNHGAELERKARILFALHRDGEAEVLFADALRRFVALDHASGIFEIVVDYAALAARRRRWDAAAALLGYAKRGAVGKMHTNHRDWERIEAPILEELGHERFDAELQRGAASELAPLLDEAGIAAQTEGAQP